MISSIRTIAVIVSRVETVIGESVEEVESSNLLRFPSECEENKLIKTSEISSAIAHVIANPFIAIHFVIKITNERSVK